MRESCLYGSVRSATGTKRPRQIRADRLKSADMLARTRAALGQCTGRVIPSGSFVAASPWASRSCSSDRPVVPLRSAPPLEARVPEVGLRETRDEEEGPFELHAHRLACSRRATMTLTDPAEGRAWAVWLLDHEPAA